MSSHRSLSLYKHFVTSIACLTLIAAYPCFARSGTLHRDSILPRKMLDTKISELFDSYDYVFKGRVTAISFKDPEDSKRFYSFKCWVWLDTMGEGTRWYKPLHNESQSVTLVYTGNEYNFYDGEDFAELKDSLICPYVVGEEYLVFGRTSKNDNFVHEDSYSLTIPTKHGAGLLGELVNIWVYEKATPSAGRH